MTHVRKRKSRFWLVPVGILAVGILLTAIACPLLWNRLAQYDALTPLHGIRSFFSRLERGDTGLADEAGFVPDRFTDRGDFLAYLRGIYGEKYDDLKFAHIEETTGTETIERRYDVYREDKRLGTLMLSAESEKGPWRARAVYQTLEPYVITAPDHVTVLVNGAALSAGEETARDAAVSTALEAHLRRLPETVTYTVNGLLAPPDLTAEAEGFRCEMITEETRITVTAYDDAAETVDTAREMSHIYAHYISQDAEFADLSSLLVNGSPFYKSAKSYSNYWYNKHLSVDFENEQAEPVVVLADDLRQVDLSFDYIVRRTHDTHSYPTAYRMLLIRKGDEWKLLDLTMR